MTKPPDISKIIADINNVNSTFSKVTIPQINLRDIIKKKSAIESILGSSKLFTEINKTNSMLAKAASSYMDFGGIAKRKSAIESILGISKMFTEINKTNSILAKAASSYMDFGGIEKQKIAIESMLGSSEMFAEIKKANSILAKVAITQLNIGGITKQNSVLGNIFSHRKVNEQSNSFLSDFQLDKSAKISNQAIDIIESLDHTINENDDLIINNDGSVTVGNESIPSVELNENLNLFFHNILEAEFLENLEEKFQQLKKPLQIIVIWIFNHIIVAFWVSVAAGTYLQYSNEIQTNLNSANFERKRDVTQHIKKISTEMCLKEYSDCRVVTEEGLRLREKPTTKSRILGLLYRGKLVKIIYKPNKWSHIEVYQEENDSTVSGWVLSKHTTKLTR